MWSLTLGTNVVQSEAPVEGIPRRCYNQKRSARFRHRTYCIHPAHNRREVNNPRSPRRAERVSKRGQVAQVVERSPEKAGVGGSTPSLATIIPKDLGAFAHFLQPKVQPKIHHWIVSVSR